MQPAAHITRESAQSTPIGGPRATKSGTDRPIAKATPGGLSPIAGHPVFRGVSVISQGPGFLRGRVDKVVHGSNRECFRGDRPAFNTAFGKWHTAGLEQYQRIPFRVESMRRQNGITSAAGYASLNVRRVIDNIVNCRLKARKTPLRRSFENRKGRALPYVLQNVSTRRPLVA